MTTETDSPARDHRGGRDMGNNGLFGGIYGLAFIGAAIYFIGHESSFWVGVLGFFKAVFWPAVLMYKVLELLQM